MLQRCEPRVVASQVIFGHGAGMQLASWGLAGQESRTCGRPSEWSRCEVHFPGHFPTVNHSTASCAVHFARCTRMRWRLTHWLLCRHTLGGNCSRRRAQPRSDARGWRGVPFLLRFASRACTMRSCGLLPLHTRAAQHRMQHGRGARMSAALRMRDCCACRCLRGARRAEGGWAPEQNGGCWVQDGR
jgi:hypothetical protein